MLRASHKLSNGLEDQVWSAPGLCEAVCELQ